MTHLDNTCMILQNVEILFDLLNFDTLGGSKSFRRKSGVETGNTYASKPRSRRVENLVSS